MYTNYIKALEEKKPLRKAQEVAQAVRDFGETIR